MVISESQIHHGSGYNLIANTDWSVDDVVHAQDGRLGGIENRSAHHAAEDPSVRNGESPPGHVLKSDFA